MFVIDESKHPPIARILFFQAEDGIRALTVTGVQTCALPIYLLLTAHALLVTLVLVAPLARQAGPVSRFLGDWYPMLLLGALYAEVGVLNVDLGYQHDQVIQRLELWVFGSQLSYRWIREMPNPLLSWFLHACYLAYYAILYASPLGLWFSGRRDAARRTIFAVMVTFYICYVVFLFFPVAGPRYTFDLAHNAATSVWPARATQWLLDLGDSRSE